MFNRDDYLSTSEIAAQWRMSRETIARWIRKGYADSRFVELHGGNLYVHKDEVSRWEAAYNGVRPLKGRPVAFKRVPA